MSVVFHQYFAVQQLQRPRSGHDLIDIVLLTVTFGCVRCRSLTKSRKRTSSGMVRVDVGLFICGSLLHLTHFGCRMHAFCGSYRDFVTLMVLSKGLSRSSCLRLPTGSNTLSEWPHTLSGVL